MRQKRGKAFTIVELVIVIAVIAILAAVLIPTFSSVIKKAKISADQQTAANINTALSAYAVENGIDGTEDLYKAISDLYGDSFQQVLQPQSASYGYHFLVRCAVEQGRSCTVFCFGFFRCTGGCAGIPCGRR